MAENIQSLLARVGELVEKIQKQRLELAQTSAQLEETMSLLNGATSGFLGDESAVAVTSSPVTERGTTRKPAHPKYRDPVSGQTWSGRGKEPAWIAGKDRTMFVWDGTVPQPQAPSVQPVQPAVGADMSPAPAPYAEVPPSEADDLADDVETSGPIADDGYPEDGPEDWLDDGPEEHDNGFPTSGGF